ncbi:MAG: RipA family octameric membrane protein [Candidatus Thorarchaeota archaeon]
MYLDKIADRIRAHIPDDRMPDENAEELLRLYAILLRAKGTDITESDIHDAWSMWIAKYQEEHESLVPYEDLTPEVREQDSVFVSAVKQAAQELGQVNVPLPLFEKVLFPSGPPTDSASTQQTIDLYKMMVSSSESLVSRRQGVNTFFLTMNGALLTAFGLFVKSAGVDQLNALAVFVLTVAGAILCGAWRSLITSFGQLNRGKFQVINTIERYLNTAIYAAEWEALERGENPKVYRSFTSREIWVPNALLVLYILAALVALLVAFGFVTFGAEGVTS